VVLDVVGLGKSSLLPLLRWPILFLVVVGALAVLYRYGPSREHERWKWVTWGSLIAAVLWLLASLAFSFYVSNFGHYDKTYGSLGAVIGFMSWIWVSTIVVLFGAELNSEIEHQTAVDTTDGAPTPMGTRGAKMADTLGAARGEKKT
jgi:membrane protein